MATDQEILKALALKPLPCAWLDLDRLYQNVETLKQLASPLKIRIASKSVRSRPLLEKLLNEFPHVFHGVLAFHPDEAVWLAGHGIKDIVVGYPYMRWFSGQHKQEFAWDEITFMADHPIHLEAIDKLGRKLNRSLNVCFDIDLSTQHFGVYFGVYRSNLKDENRMTAMLDALEKLAHLKLRGVMGYEAQIAGVGDANPFKRAMNPAISLLKKRSWPKVSAKRQALVKMCLERGHKLEFVNGGGTGSLHITKTDPSVTEVAAGSGLFTPLLFDYYKDFKLSPAAGFALEITRCPKPGTHTAAGGGYIASGATGPDKSPAPMAFQNLKLEINEGLGEVQTPLHQAENLNLSDTVLFRHAKAGELCERFKELQVIKDSKLETTYATYRGEAQCFL